MSFSFFSFSSLQIVLALQRKNLMIILYAYSATYLMHIADTHSNNEIHTFFRPPKTVCPSFVQSHHRLLFPSQKPSLYLKSSA